VLSPVAMFGYAAAQIIISAISRSSATARNTLLNALQTGSNLPVSTIAGNFTFLPTGDQLDPELYFYTVRDGKFTYAHQAHPSTFMMK
jgi:ABC-type branched-subunit amino acid transport system substrate-binding protein